MSRTENQVSSRVFIATLLLALPSAAEDAAPVAAASADAGVTVVEQPAAPADTGIAVVEEAAASASASASADAGAAVVEQAAASANGGTTVAEPAPESTDSGMAADAQPAPQQAPAAVEAPPAEAPRKVAFTGIRGKVTDAETGEGLIDAPVKVVKGGTGMTTTDIDGNFELKLPPGTYDLRVWYDLYEGRGLGGVVVRAGQPTELDIALAARTETVQEVVVEVRADRKSESALLAERKKSAVVSDAISAQEIARTPDSSASDAVKRMVSASVVDNKFVLLRGLGGRYSATLLNGSMMPSPEPDEPAVPLDIFPNSLLANLNVVKSYTPDLPGTFGGGALLIETNSYPQAFEFRPSISFSGNSETTFRQRQTFAGGARELPSQVPTDGPIRRDMSGDVARSFDNVWSASRTGALPNGSIGASVGDTLRLGGQQLGYLASVTWNRKESTQRSVVGRVDRGGEGNSLRLYDIGTAERGTLSTGLSGLLNLGYRISSNDELSLLSLYTRDEDTRAQTVSAMSEGDQNQTIDGTRLQFVSRALLFNQVHGFHRLPGLGNLELDWTANYSRVDRAEPDTRDVAYRVDSTGLRVYRNGPGDGMRFFADLAEDSTGGSLNFTYPLSSVKLKAGGFTQVSWRQFDARRFRFFYRGGASDALSRTPEELFAPEHLGPNVLMQEDTRNEDAYRAYLGIFAGYLMADANLTDKLRLVGGARYETSTQELTSRNAFSVTGGTPEVGRQVYADVLPTANLVYSVSDKVNLRAGYSYTLARPTFRELAPFMFYDFVRRGAVSGNKDLVATRIHNGDLRAEWFPGEKEVLAASVFAKRFEDPIERVFVNYADISYANADSALVYGLELEARASLGRITKALSDFSAAANLTLLQSQVELGAAQGIRSGGARPLQGQSPYIVNVNLTYDRPEIGTGLALLYNVYGPRISEVGVESIPDAYEQPFHRLDVSITQSFKNGMKLKLTGSNLLDSPITLHQGDFTVLQYRPGLAVSAQLGWSI